MLSVWWACRGSHIPPVGQISAIFIDAKSCAGDDPAQNRLRENGKLASVFNAGPFVQPCRAKYSCFAFSEIMVA
jgi:hypothetical protein